MKTSECLVGKGARLEGTFSCSGFLRIEGECSGELSVRGALVIIEGARVEAAIDADDVIVAGMLRGTVLARHSVRLASTASVRADITTPRFALEDGGLFSGTVSIPAVV
ncbi:MAG: polymer-forming cytoskeletal protein [Rectinemataceae bacterium]